MKKLISLSMLAASIAFTGTFASAQTYDRQNNRPNQNQPVFRDGNDRNNRENDRNNWEYNNGNWHGNRRVKVEMQTRIVKQGRKLFRETVEIKHFPNGRKVTTIIKRVRIDR
ncbi:MAG: hypothetical protein LUM44_10340 [Pyrinomonadaceae bacterium]|nr:hypothetical protein [Pyrinomonadaceae bacterium]